MKKFLLTLVAVVVSCVAMAANNMRSESVNDVLTINASKKLIISTTRLMNF
jgi:hypothetical protein